MLEIPPILAASKLKCQCPTDNDHS